MGRFLLRAAAAAALAVPFAAQAQSIPADEPTVFDGDWLTVGIGAGYAPSYEGSDDYVVYPQPVVQGRLKGIDITARPGGAVLDFIPDPQGAKVGFALGPIARLRANRDSNIQDRVVRRLGKLDKAVEVGVGAGVTIYDLATGYDTLTFSSDVKWDVAGAHKGMTMSPRISYFTPVSRGIAVGLSLDAEHVDDDYANYYFTVTPAGSAASGLPAFDADGGWKSAGVNLLVGVDFDGELANGGLAAFFTGGYSRLLGDARRTPLTSIRGDADQWIGSAGIAYTF